MSLAVADSDIDLSVSETQPIKVYAIYADGTVPSIVDNANLTFRSDDDTIATVTDAGLVTAASAGSTNIEIVATDKPSLSAYAVVTVS